METADGRVEIIELLAAHEAAIARLYNVYGEVLTGYRDFWQRLAREETRHATWLKNLAVLAERGEISVDRRRFAAEVIKKSMEYMDREYETAAGGLASIESALDTAGIIEKSMLESEYFKILEADSPQVQKILTALAADTDEHLQKIKRARSQIG